MGQNRVGGRAGYGETGLSPSSVVPFQETFPHLAPFPFSPCTTIPWLPVPSATDSGMGSSRLTRRYEENHGYFLFLGLLICLSSARSLAGLRAVRGFAARTHWATARAKTMAHSPQQHAAIRRPAPGSQQQPPIQASTRCPQGHHRHGNRRGSYGVC